MRSNCTRMNAGRTPSSGCKPVFKKCGCLQSFDPPPDGIHHAATGRTLAPVEAEPIRQMQFTRSKRNFETRIAKLEESLLENDAQGSVAQKSGSLFFVQNSFEPIAVTSRQQFSVIGNSRKFEQVERTINGIHGKKTRRHVSALHPKQEIRHIHVCNAPQGSAADSPVKTGKACS